MSPCRCKAPDARACWAKKHPMGADGTCRCPCHRMGVQERMSRLAVHNGMELMFAGAAHAQLRAAVELLKRASADAGTLESGSPGTGELITKAIDAAYGAMHRVELIKRGLFEGMKKS